MDLLEMPELCFVLPSTQNNANFNVFFLLMKKRKYRKPFCLIQAQGRMAYLNREVLLKLLSFPEQESYLVSPGDLDEYITYISVCKWILAALLKAKASK